jgi:CRP-like cAMP-binding protein
MERDEGLQVLAESRWLAATPPEFRTAFLALARWHRAEAGAAITLAGDEAEDIIGLASGTVGFTLSHGRPDTPMLHLAKAPFWMGYGPLLLGRPRVVTVVARTPCRFASFSRAKLALLVESRPGWWRPFTALVGEYGDTTSLIAADLAIPRSEGRLLAVLLRFGGARFAGPADAGEIEVPVTQDELAAAANLSRNSTGTILRRFSDQGLVRTAYRTITITAPDRLRALIEV